MIDLQLIKKKTYDCYQNNIISVACNYFSCDIEPYFFNSFDFRFFKEKLCTQSILDSECISNNTHIDYLLLYSGLKISCLDFIAEYEKDNRVIMSEKLKKEGILGLRVNSYYIPWYPYYKQINRVHFLMLIGIDNNEALCMDPYYSAKIEKITWDNLVDSVDQIYTFEKRSPLRKVDYSNLHKLFSELVYIDNSKKIRDMIDFADYIKSYLLKDEDILRYKDINRSALFFELTRVGWSRENYRNSIIYIINKLGDRESEWILPKLKVVYQYWDKIKLMMIHGFLRGKKDIFYDIAHYIRIIAELEAELYEEIVVRYR